MALSHCADCNFSTESSLWNHRNSMHVGTVFSCKKCSYTSRSKRGLNNHIKAHHEGKIYPCPQCVCLCWWHESSQKIKAWRCSVLLQILLTHRKEEEWTCISRTICSFEGGCSNMFNLWEDISKKRSPKEAQAKPHWWKAIYMLPMWQEIPR